MIGKESERSSEEGIDSNNVSNQRITPTHFATMHETVDYDSDEMSFSSVTDLESLGDTQFPEELFALSDYIRSQRHKRQRVTESSKDLRPITFIRFNTRLGKPKPITIKALLDSGASGSLIHKRYTDKLRVKTRSSSTVWATPAGDLTTSKKTKAVFTMPELCDDQVIEWPLHVADNMGAYDMILGRDLLAFLGIDIRFSDRTVNYRERSLPFKPYDATPETGYHVEESMAITESADRIKEILEAKYEAADLNDICQAQKHLTADEQGKLHTLLSRYEELFDGTLGTWNLEPVDIELLPDAKPYHARAYPVPRCHEATLRMEVTRLVELGVLKKVNRSEWGAPSFIIPKKDGTVRFINDFRELNKRIRRKPYPIPNIQDMLLNLDGFKYATSLDLNMGYYHIKLSPRSRRLCTLVFPFGKYEMQRLPMGLCNSPDIFQEKMSELFDGLEFVRTYIDDLLILTKGTFEEHLASLERVLHRLEKAGLKVNGKKSFFAKFELEYLGYWITREGIKPLPDKVQAILALDVPRNRKELRSFIGIVNYYRDMWVRRSHVLAPLASLTSKNTPWSWGPKQETAFQTAKKIIAREVMLSYPDFSQPFVIHTDASHYQLGAVISQGGKPIAFYSRKLNPAQTRYTTTERELLSIVETLKEYRNVLLGHRIKVYTDHKNLVYKTFNTERVMRWRLIIEEYGPELVYVKGESNIVADALSRMRLTETDFSEEAFAGDEDHDFPTEYPLTYRQIAYEQARDDKLQARLKSKDEKKYYKKKTYTWSDKSYDLITRDDKIVIPASLERPAVEWYHEHLLHPGSTRLELTLRQHYTFIGLKTRVEQVTKACMVCKSLKKSQAKCGMIPVKANPEWIPWHTL